MICQAAAAAAPTSSRHTGDSSGRHDVFGMSYAACVPWNEVCLFLCYPNLVKKLDPLWVYIHFSWLWCDIFILRLVLVIMEIFQRESLQFQNLQTLPGMQLHPKQPLHGMMSGKAGMSKPSPKQPISFKGSWNTRTSTTGGMHKGRYMSGGKLPGNFIHIFTWVLV